MYVIAILLLLSAFPALAQRVAVSMNWNASAMTWNGVNMTWLNGFSAVTSESISLLENASLASGYYRNASDITIPKDAVARSYAANRLVSEANLIGNSSASLASHFSTGSESLSVGALITVVSGHFASTSENVLGTNQSAALHNFGRSAIETLGAQDHAFGIASHIATTSESMIFSGSTSIARAIVRSIADSLTIAEAFTTSSGRARSSIENLTLTESIVEVNRRQLTRSVVEMLTLAANSAFGGAAHYARSAEFLKAVDVLQPFRIIITPERTALYPLVPSVASYPSHPTAIYPIRLSGVAYPKKSNEVKYPIIIRDTLYK